MRHPRRLAPLAFLAFASSNVKAATVTKSDTTSMQANATNWSAAPSSTDIGSFTDTLSATNAANLTLGGDLSIGRLLFNNSMNGPVAISNSGTLTLNNGVAIDGSYSNQNITIHAPVVVATAGNTFEADNSRATTLTFTNTITSTQKIIWRAGIGIFGGGGSYSALDIGSRSGITSTVRLGANNGIATNALVTIGTANGSARLDLAGFAQSLAGIAKGDQPAIIGNSSTTSDSVLTLTGTSSYSGIIQDSIDSGTKNVGLVINGGTLTLTANNTYTGDTVIKSGTLKLDTAGNIQASKNLIIGDTGSTGTTLDVTTTSSGFTIGSSQTVGGIGHLDASGKTVTVNGTLATNGIVDATTVTVSSGGKLTGTGTINASTTISGMHAPGGGVGLQTIGSDLSYASGSIFEWEIAADALGVRGTDYDGVNVTGNLSADSGAIFRVVLAGANLANGFWDTDRSWTGIFSKSFTSGGFSTANLQVWSGGSAYDTSGQGVFSINGGTLHWTAVPEPSGSVVAILAMAGMLRRRR